MAPEIARTIRHVTFALLALAAFAVEVAAVDTRPLMESLGLAIGWIVAAAVLAFHAPAGRSILQAAAVGGWRRCGSRVSSVRGRTATSRMDRRRLPARTSNGFRPGNVGLALAACAGWVLCLRLACVVSLFLVLFSAAMSNHTAVLVVLGLYTATGSVWLMLAYWAKLKNVFVASTGAVEVEVQTRRERLPWVSLFVVVALVGVVLGLIAVGPARASRTLGEWFPSSGGTGDYDPFARGGVNDGDEETTGDNAQSTGMVQTDSYLNSPMPSLYDVTSDLYGPPCKPHEREQSIALDTDKARDAGKHPPDSQRPNREFPTARQGSNKPNVPKERLARPSSKSKGEHRCMCVWSRSTASTEMPGAAPMTGNRALIEQEGDSNWMRIVGREPPPVFAKSETHAFKLTAPEGSFIPTPPHLARFRIGRVNKANFFGWSQDRVLRFAERKTPSGISVETESRTVDPHKLTRIEFPTPSAGEWSEYVALPPNLDSRIVALALLDRRQTGRLAANCRSRRTPARGVHAGPFVSDAERLHRPARAFSWDRNAERDYQFATAAVVMLRVLGYQLASRAASTFTRTTTIWRQNTRPL